MMSRVYPRGREGEKKRQDDTWMLRGGFWVKVVEKDWHEIANEDHFLNFGLCDISPSFLLML